MGLRKRLSYEISKAGWDDETREKLRFAEELAIEAHKYDTRGDHPYSTHFFRVATRILSWDHIDVSDPDIIIAALLHDTVEDRAEYYMELSEFSGVLTLREHALRAIAEQFGERVARLVSAVTNPEVPPHITEREDRYEFYREHVREVLATDEEAGIIKLSDFIDNCVGLPHNESPALALKLAQKYSPLIPDFLRFIDESTLIPADRKQHLITQLMGAKAYCVKLLSAA